MQGKKVVVNTSIYLLLRDDRYLRAILEAADERDTWPKFEVEGPESNDVAPDSGPPFMRT